MAPASHSQGSATSNDGLGEALAALRSVCPPHVGSAAQAYRLDDAFIPWADHGILLAEFARLRGLDHAAWLATAGVGHGQPLSARQLLALLAPLQRHAKDSAFVLGQLALPGHYGLASQALRQSAHLLDALKLLARYPARLSPLLTPRLLVHEAQRELLLVWTDACGCPAAQRPFLVDMQMSAVVAMARWLGGEALPWRFAFNRTRPGDLSQHAAYLGSDLRFDCQLDAMRLDLASALRPWDRSAPQASSAHQALNQGADPHASRRGLLAAMYEVLMLRETVDATLLNAAQVFAISPATLKRHLAQHGTHFQAELDMVRAHQALYLMHVKGQPQASVAKLLGFYDTANFRRSFRRWTGLTPQHVTA